jgi:hypothetical protein
MQGLLIFEDTLEAIAHGFEIYDRTREGYILVRRRTESGYGLAIALREVVR